MAARLPRLDGVEHEDGCPDERKALAFAGSTTSSGNGKTVTMFSARCASCSLSVNLAGSILLDREGGAGHDA